MNITAETEKNQARAEDLFIDAYTARLEEMEQEKGTAIPRDGIDDVAREWWHATVNADLLPLSEEDCSEAGRASADEILPNVIADVEKRNRMAEQERVLAASEQYNP